MLSASRPRGAGGLLRRRLDHARRRPAAIELPLQSPAVAQQLLGAGTPGVAEAGCEPDEEPGPERRAGAISRSYAGEPSGGSSAGRNTVASKTDSSCVSGSPSSLCASAMTGAHASGSSGPTLTPVAVG